MKMKNNLHSATPGRTEKKCDNCNGWNAYDAERCVTCGIHIAGPKRKRRDEDSGAESHDGRCDWNANGRRCRYPASISTSTMGGGPWYCGLHYECHDARIGEDYLQASMDYRHVGQNERISELQRMIAQTTNATMNHREDVLAMVRNVSRRAGSRNGSNTAWAHAIIERHGIGGDVSGIALDKARLALGLDESIDIDML
jgi:hypothetical protein